MADLELNEREAYGQLFFINNIIESTTGNIDIEIGLTGSTADLKFNRNTVLAPGKTFGFVDTTTFEIVRLSVTDGVLNIDGANQLQVGELKFVNNTIESISGATDIEIGLTASTANLVLNRNTVLASGKSLTFGNGSVQTHSSDVLLTSYIDGNIGATVDLTKQVLVMSDGTWILPDGQEGQIMYFTLDNGGSAEDSYLTVNHLRYNNNGLGTQVINGSWSPFQYGSGQPDFAICTAIFTDGYWAFSGGRLRV